MKYCLVSSARVLRTSTDFVCATLFGGCASRACGVKRPRQATAWISRSWSNNYKGAHTGNEVVVLEERLTSIFEGRSGGTLAIVQRTVIPCSPTRRLGMVVGTTSRCIRPATFRQFSPRYRCAHRAARIQPARFEATNYFLTLSPTDPFFNYAEGSRMTTLFSCIDA